jgi:oligopeptidase B
MINIKPPVAKKNPYITKSFNDELIDNYHWLRDAKWPEITDHDILDYLKEENNYYQNIMKDVEDSEEIIYKEILAHIKLSDSTVPIKEDKYYYYTKTEANSNHKIYCRKKDLYGSDEEIIFDPNTMAQNFEFFNPGVVSVSSDHTKAVFSYDNTGGEKYTAVVKDINKGLMLNDSIEDTIGEIVWSEDNEGFYYTKLNENWRADQVYYHILGSKQEDDELIYKETSTLFEVSVSKSSSKRFVFIYSNSLTNNEVRYIDTKDKNKTLSLIEPSKTGHLYYLDHRGDSFYIRTNDLGKNFRLVVTNIQSPKYANWSELLPHSTSSYLYDISVYKNYFVASVKNKGLTVIKVIDYNGKNIREIPFPDQAYSASVVFTTFEDNKVRILYTSLNTPETIMEYNYSDNNINVLKVTELPSGYDKDVYKTERIFAKGRDGVKIPISLVYKKSLLKKNGSNPLYIYGYGAYGVSVPLKFRPHIIPLLDRGFVYAIAHVRGGDDMGKEWHENGKFLKKFNTFDDFIACTAHLINKKYTSKGQIVIAGESGGGMLVGVCLNERPDLYRAALAHVPFVDVLNTMLDNTLPLTPLEYKEWGNPGEEEYYNYIKSYSPYDNIKKQNYPAMFVTSGINDPRVTYWEPAKWVAKLRAMKTDNNVVLLLTNMKAGHAGNAGRFGYLRDIAKEHNFVFKVFGFKVKKGEF